MGVEDLKKPRQPGRMGRPRRASQQLSIHHRVEKVQRDKGSSGKLNLLTKAEIEPIMVRKSRPIGPDMSIASRAGTNSTPKLSSSSSA
jgi:hypothetical protein